jgi:hypothetical protein
MKDFPTESCPRVEVLRPQTEGSRGEVGIDDGTRGAVSKRSALSCLTARRAAQRLRRKPKGSQERSTHAAGITEAGRFGDLVERCVAVFDAGPCVLQSEALHGLCRRRPCLLDEGASEVPRAHGGTVGEAFHRQRFREMRAHPLDQFHKAAGSPTHLHQPRELRLAARPSLMHDELLRGVACDLRAEIVLDEREREVDTGRDARGGPDLAIADEDAIGLECHVRIAPPEMLRAAPVRRRAAAVQPSGLGQEKGPRALPGFEPGRPSPEDGVGGERQEDVSWC